VGRAGAARKLVAAAAYGGGGLSVVGASLYGLLRAEATVARRTIGRTDGEPPDSTGWYGRGRPGPVVKVALLGDSSAAGYGVESVQETPGAHLASGVAEFANRRVYLRSVAFVGAQTRDLSRQIDRALGVEPHVAVIMIGANDVTHSRLPSESVRLLALAVRRLREHGAEVVVGTCPDLGAVEPLPQPLRWLARRWSRDLAAAQTVAVVEAGGRAVSVGDMLGAAFSADPKTMFSEDRFHPSAAGYARVAAALLPSVSAALDLFGERTTPTRPSPQRGEGIGPVAKAATLAVAHPGTEVAPAEIAGQARGRQGRWAVLRHRIRPAVPASTADPQPVSHGAAPEGSAATAAAGSDTGGGDDTDGRMPSREDAPAR
jgi:lysophospholipase L1-like esterase